MGTSCHDATIVMTISLFLLLFPQNVALHDTMVSDVTIAQTDATIAAP